MNTSTMIDGCVKLYPHLGVMLNHMDNDDKRKPSSASLHKIKTSVSSRSFSLARIGLQAGLSYLNHKIQKATQDSNGTELMNQFLTKQSKILGQELGQLKGSLMKAGQMLSMYGEYFLPPEANAFLKKLQSDSPPLVWSEIEKALNTYLSKEQQDLLLIEKQAYACASMGQVHRAQIKHSQEWIALKIQYPNVDKAIESDLKALKTLLNMMGLVPKEFNPDPLFDEVRTMLEQEVRYDQEAELTNVYRTHLEGDSRYLVPKVYSEFCGSKVLATEFMPGLRVDDEKVQNLSQERRNELAKSFLHLFFKELFEWHLVQTDPHLGNYKVKLNFDGKDQIVLLDFGATRSFSKEFMNDYKALIRAGLYDDTEGFLKACYRMGFLKPEDSDELKNAFQDFCSSTLEPFKSTNYNWKETTLPQRVTQKAMKLLRGFTWRTPPQDIVFLDRKTGGVFIFLSILGAEINAREILEKYL